MKLPKIGENFYWKDHNGIIHEEICLKIEEEDNPDLETMFFTWISKNGGGSFIVESDLISPNSKDVKKFLKEQAKKKIKEVEDYISQNDIRNILFEKLVKHAFTRNEANKILNILGNE